MKFKLQGNIEKANYFLIYKYFWEYSDHPVFIWTNGERSNIFNMEEDGNYWFNINEINENNNFNFSNLEGWTIECFIDCPVTNEIVYPNSNKFNYRELISYLRLSSMINDNYNIEAINLLDLKEIIIKSKLQIKKKKNKVINFDRFSVLNYNPSNQNNNKYILIKTKNDGYILNDFSGYSKSLMDKKIYFDFNKFNLNEETKKILTNIGFNNLSIIFSNFTCSNIDKILLLAREIFNKPIHHFDNMDFNKLDNIIKNISKNKQEKNPKVIKSPNIKEFQILIKNLNFQGLI